jgi:hypothetical protein
MTRKAVFSFRVFRVFRGCQNLAALTSYAVDGLLEHGFHDKTFSVAVHGCSRWSDFLDRQRGIQ